MIKGLFETHLFVSSLERSKDFYENTLGLQFAYEQPERKVAFYWIGGVGEAMLGLWEKPIEQVQTRHFAFRCEVDFIQQKSEAFLADKNLVSYNFLKDGSQQPMVFCWMPALAIYFDDPDGHALEFIGMLDGPQHPEWGVLDYDTWKNRINT